MTSKVFWQEINGRKTRRYCRRGHDKSVTGITRHGQCQQCLFEFRQRVREKRRRKVNAYKVAKGCALCGYSRSAAALDFHHRDAADKLFSIGPRITSGLRWSLIVAEIRKCDVLCRNCHAELHEEEKRR